jgi:imidazolonepropionase-like amidohydrolase
MLCDPGLTPKEQAIVHAPTHLASMLTGSLEVGKLADLIVVASLAISNVDSVAIRVD